MTPAQTAGAEAGLSRRFLMGIAGASALMLGLLVVVVYGPKQGHSALDVSVLPAVNASLNALSAVLLVAGVISIRAGRRAVHQRFMVAALTSSACFLCSYLVYHSVHGDTRYGGEGVLRTVYFTVLISHILLSVVLVPLILTTLALAVKGGFARHRRLARVTFPIWMYVSVTGVVIFFMLRS